MGEEKIKKLLLMAPALYLKLGQMIEARLEKAQKRLKNLSFKNNHEGSIDFIRETVLLSSNSHNGSLIIDNSLIHERIAKTNFHQPAGSF